MPPLPALATVFRDLTWMGLFHHPQVPVNEGEPCGPPSPAPLSGGVPASASSASPFTPCVQRVCRAGRCVSEPLPDGAGCGPAGPCREHHCRAGVCVPMVEEDGVMCGPSTACATHVSRSSRGG